MKYKLSRIVNGEKCYWGTYDLSELSEAEAFAKAAHMFGEQGRVVIVEREEEENE